MNAPFAHSHTKITLTPTIFLSKSHTSIGCHSPSKQPKWGEHICLCSLLNAPLLTYVERHKTSECVVLCAHNWYWSERTYRQIKKLNWTRCENASSRTALHTDKNRPNWNRDEKYYSEYISVRLRMGENHIPWSNWNKSIFFHSRNTETHTEHKSLLVTVICLQYHYTHETHGSNAHDSPIECDWSICASTAMQSSSAYRMRFEQLVLYSKISAMIRCYRFCCPNETEERKNNHLTINCHHKP